MRPDVHLNRSPARPEPPTESRPCALRRLVIIGCLLAAGLCFWYAAPPSLRPTLTTGPAVAAPEAAIPTVEEPQVTERLLTRPIRDIRPGMRVLAENPEHAGLVIEPLEIEPEDWRLVIFETTAPDGALVESHVLCEQEFLAIDDIAVGQVLDLSFEEFGFSGPSRVVAVTSCPPVEQGAGRIVTAVFKISAANVIDVHVQSLDEPLGTTPTHPFWSETRGTFVPAGELRVEEVLRTATGRIDRVTAVVPRTRREPVYNLQVEGEHVYYVSDAGVLVHNQCIAPDKWESLVARRLEKDGYKVLGNIKNASGHGVDVLLRDAAGNLVVVEVKSSGGYWRGLSKRQKSMGSRSYLADAAGRAAPGGTQLWAAHNLRGGSASLAAQAQNELRSGVSVTGILVQINERSRQMRVLTNYW